MSINQLKKLLTIPGNGVFTVHTAKDKKESYWENNFSTSDIKKVETVWSKQLEDISQYQTAILGVCSDAGGGIQRGANWGPLFIRDKISSLLSNILDLGDIRVIPHLLHDKYLNKNTIENCQKALYGDNEDDLPVSPLSMTEHALDIVYEVNPNLKVIGLGGDHSVSYPLVKSWINSRKDLSKCALIHFDAHTDLMDERLGIDLCFGSWTYHILKLLPSPNHLVQLGIRSSGEERSHWENKFKHSQIWSNEIKDLGADEISDQVIKKYKKLGIEEIYISFDIDALDSEYAGATGTPEADGLLPHEAILMIKKFVANFKLTGADLVEVAPFVNFKSTNLEPDSTLLQSKLIVEQFLQ